MKKIVYETDNNSSVGFGTQMIRVSELERSGFHVVVSKDVPDDPKIERCEIIATGDLHYTRGKSIPLSVGQAIDDPHFAGFEYASGFISNNPWSRSVENERCIEHTRRTFDEHAKYVLFRL